MDQLIVGRRVDSSKMLFRRIAGVSAILAVLIGGLSGVLFLAAGRFNLDGLLDPVRLLGVGSSRAQLLRWGALTDMLGYYLLLVPLVVCVGSELRPRGGPIVDLFTVAGVLYAAIGATAAVVVSAAVRITQVGVGTGPAIGYAALAATLFAAYMVWLALLLLRQTSL